MHPLCDPIFRDTGDSLRCHAILDPIDKSEEYVMGGQSKRRPCYTMLSDVDCTNTQRTVIQARDEEEAVEGIQRGHVQSARDEVVETF